MPEVALTFIATAIMFGSAIIAWVLEYRWQTQPRKVRQKWALALILLLFTGTFVDFAVTVHAHGQQREEQERAARIEEGMQELVKLARERDPTLTEQEALREVIEEIQALRGRTSELERELEGVKKYGSVAKLNMIGLTGKAGDGIHESNWVLPELEDAYDYEKRNGETHASIRCDEEAISIFEKAAETNPDFPFSYSSLAICKAKNGVEDWQGDAQRAVAILEHTTEIAGHHINHDWALKAMRKMLDLQRREIATTQ